MLIRDRQPWSSTISLLFCITLHLFPFINQLLLFPHPIPDSDLGLDKLRLCRTCRAPLSIVRPPLVYKKLFFGPQSTGDKISDQYNHEDDEISRIINRKGMVGCREEIIIIIILKTQSTEERLCFTHSTTLNIW